MLTLSSQAMTLTGTLSKRLNVTTRHHAAIPLHPTTNNISKPKIYHRVLRLRGLDWVSMWWRRVNDFGACEYICAVSCWRKTRFGNGFTVFFFFFAPVLRTKRAFDCGSYITSPGLVLLALIRSRAGRRRCHTCPTELSLVVTDPILHNYTKRICSVAYQET